MSFDFCYEIPMVRITHLSMVKADGSRVMLWGIFCWHRADPELSLIGMNGCHLKKVLYLKKIFGLRLTLDLKWNFYKLSIAKWTAPCTAPVNSWLLLRDVASLKGVMWRLSHCAIATFIESAPTKWSDEEHYFVPPGLSRTTRTRQGNYILTNHPHLLHISLERSKFLHANYCYDRLPRGFSRIKTILTCSTRGLTDNFHYSSFKLTLNINLYPWGTQS